MKKYMLSGALCAVVCSFPLLPAQADEASPDALKWSGRANFGGFVTDGNSDKKAVVLDGMVKARDQKNRYMTGGELRYAEDEGVETENEYTVYAEYDRFISEKLYAGGRIDYKVDDIADLDHRMKVGPHLGYQFYEGELLNLSSRIGVDYIDEKYANGDTAQSAGGNWGVDYDQKIFEEALQLFYKHDLSVPFNDTENFFFESEAGVRFPVAKILTGTAQVDFDWDNMPAPGKTEEDVTYSLKLGYEF